MGWDKNYDDGLEIGITFFSFLFVSLARWQWMFGFSSKTRSPSYLSLFQWLSSRLRVRRKLHGYTASSKTSLYVSGRFLIVPSFFLGSALIDPRTPAAPGASKVGILGKKNFRRDDRIRARSNFICLMCEAVRLRGAYACAFNCCFAIIFRSPTIGSLLLLGGLRDTGYPGP
jgi:hypothetical protein